MTVQSRQSVPNLEYKSRMFVRIFEDKQKLLELYMNRASKYTRRIVPRYALPLSAPLRSVLNGCPPDIQHPAKYSESMGPLPHFFLIFWRVNKSFIHCHASMAWIQTFDPGIL